MAITIGGLQVDPDSLSYEIAPFYNTTTSELVVDTTHRLLKLTQTGNLTRDGLTLKCLYSKLKDIWANDDATFIYPFPMRPITDEQYEFINGWNLDTDGTTFVGSISGTTLTVSSVTTGSIQVGQLLTGSGNSILSYTYIVSGSGSTWTVSRSQTVISTNIIATTINPTTKTTLTNISGTSGQTTITAAAPTNFNSSFVTANSIVLGSGIAPGATVTSISSDGLTITLSAANTGTVSGSITFYNRTDFTYNLIRFGGWALKDSSGVSQEEWAGIVTLGDMSEQRVNLNLTTTAAISAGAAIVGKIDNGSGSAGTTLTVASVTSGALEAGQFLTGAGIPANTYIVSGSGSTWTVNNSLLTASNITILAGTYTITVADTSGIVAGSYVASVATRTGTVVSAVTSSTTFTVNKIITTALPLGAVVTIRPSVYVYYQLGSSSSASATNAVLHGTVEQALKVYGDSSHGNFDYRAGTFNIFLREQGFTYDTKALADVGKSSFSYDTTRFALTNASDIHITNTDTQISSNSNTATPTQSPYSNMTITWYDTPQARVIGGTTYYFNVIINADTSKTGSYSDGAATPMQIYEFVQWSLRRGSSVDIDAGTGTKVGQITRELLEFRGNTLYTKYDSDGGVYIDNFDRFYINDLVFTDNSENEITYPYVAYGELQFDPFLINDVTVVGPTTTSNTVYRLFFNQINQGYGSLKYTNSDAVLVKSLTYDLSGDGSYEVKDGLLTLYQSGTDIITYDFDYDGNTQADWLPLCSYAVGDEYKYDGVWYRVTIAYTAGETYSAATDGLKSIVIAGPTVILTAIGLSGATWASIDGTIEKSTANFISITSTKENNYATS